MIKKNINITFTFVGDVSFARDIREEYHKKYDKILKPTQNLLTKTDFLMFNLESAVTNKSYRYADPRGGWRSKTLLVSHPSAVEALKNLKTNNNEIVVSLANNHILDATSKGVDDTITILKKNDFKSIGICEGCCTYDCNVKPTEYTSTIIEKKGIKIGFVGFSEYFFRYNSENMIKTKTPEHNKTPCMFIGPPNENNNEIYRGPFIKKIMQNLIDNGADVIITYVHWRKEYIDKPIKRHYDVCKMLIKYGSDLIVASGPHTVIEPEWIDDVPVLFSLGNFIFDSHVNFESTHTSIIVYADLINIKRKKQSTNRFFRGKLNKDCWWFDAIPCKIDSTGVPHPF